MRILYHHRTLADGAEGIHIASMVDAFRRLGHTVLVQGLGEARHPTAAPRLAHRLRRSLPRPAFELAAAAANVAELAQMHRQIRAFSPDFVYKRHARFDVAALLAARRTGIPTVLEVNSLFTQGSYHGFEPLALKGLGVWFERRALRLATVVIAVSSPLARQVQDMADRPVVVIPNGADPAHFDPQSARPQEVRLRHRLAELPVIGWSGILRDWHGLELLLEAVQPLRHAQLLIVGDGPARQALEQQVTHRGMRDRVVVTGRVSHDEMPHYIAAMDVAVVADERTGVASPMKLLEYMSMAKPVVAPRLPNIEDIVEDGRDALLFRQGHASDLREALSRLIDDPSLRNHLGGRARHKICEQRNWAGIAQQVVGLV